MGCPTSVVLGDNLVFSICTHDPDTGVLTDADAVPDYRVYEDETGTAILTGSMAKLDDANTTGFYTELLACTTGNGFELGKTYTTGGIAYGFNVSHNTYTVAGEIDANMQSINDAALTGTGQEGVEWGPA
jgi:hypothetical protein